MLTLAVSALPADDARPGDPAIEPEPPLLNTCRDLRRLPWLYQSLLTSMVYVADCELVLGDHGPYVELLPARDDRGRALAVHTSRERMTEPLLALEAVAVPFTEVLRGLEPDVAVVVDPDGPCHRIDPATLEQLRRISAGH